MYRSMPWRTYVLPIALTSAWLTLTANGQYWRLISNIAETWDQPAPLFLASIALVSFLFVNLILTLLTFGRATRYILCTFLLVSAAIAYFMSQYGILIDQDMVRNTLETDRFEAAELINWNLAWSVSLFGLVPAVVIWRLSPVRQTFVRSVVEKLSVITITLALISGNAALFYKDYSSLLRNHREIKYLLTPMNYVVSTYKVISTDLETPIQTIAIGTDAHKGNSWNQSKRKTLAVVVVGETARASNFSLGGYTRNTNPRLAAIDPIYFDSVSSCGTATAVSLPCMFSDLNRSNYSKAIARNREGLLDVIKRSGIKTLWIDNNSGCKGVCRQSAVESVARADTDGLCHEKGCFDGVLVDRLQSMISNISEDTVVVLHKNGSHGPSYYRRYPDSFRVFQPECQSDDFANCTKEQIVNSYDNTILYTDYVLAELIELLAEYSDTLNTALLYVSDHGESLGENGLYLHGAPYFISPEVQTSVPMLLWMSSAYQDQFSISRSCIEAAKGDEISHDYLFHSVLGMMNIETNARNPELDIFSKCRAGRVLASNRPPDTNTSGEPLPGKNSANPVGAVDINTMDYSIRVRPQ